VASWSSTVSWAGPGMVALWSSTVSWAGPGMVASWSSTVSWAGPGIVASWSSTVSSDMTDFYKPISTWQITAGILSMCGVTNTTVKPLAPTVGKTFHCNVLHRHLLIALSLFSFSVNCLVYH